jgi:hypothetical protein
MHSGPSTPALLTCVPTRRAVIRFHVGIEPEFSRLRGQADREHARLAKATTELAVPRMSSHILVGELIVG